ncbi:MAG: type II toxin-antitoxin system VapC family toxin [Terriglobia bacterium]
MQSRRKYYWNTDVFLAWLKGEQGRVELVEGIVSEVNKGVAVIVTSVITRTEVFEGNLDNKMRKNFRLLMGRRDVTEVNVDPAVADLARELREHCKARGESLKTPDAQHLATAILHKVDEFHTFDDKLLRYNDNIAGHPIRICKPQAKQPLLPLGSD